MSRRPRPAPIDPAALRAFIRGMADSSYEQPSVWVDAAVCRFGDDAADPAWAIANEMLSTSRHAATRPC